MDLAWPSDVDIYKQPWVVNSSLHDYQLKTFSIVIVSTTIFGADDGVVCSINSTHRLSFRDAFKLLWKVAIVRGESRI